MKSLYQLRFLLTVFVKIQGLVLLLFMGLQSAGQPTAAEASASMAQNAPAPLASPPGLAPEHLFLLYRPRYTLVPPALFEITRNGKSGTVGSAPAAGGNTSATTKPANGGYQPLPISPRAAGAQYDNAPAGGGNAGYQSLRLIPAHAPLAGSHVPIPAPLVARGGNNAYDGAPPGRQNNGRPLMPARSHDLVPAQAGTGGSNSGIQYSSLPADNASGSRPGRAAGSQRSNGSSSFKTETTAGSNSGYQPLPVHPGNAPLPGSNVAVPKPPVSNESQRSNASSSFKTETTAGSNSGYQSLPVHPGNVSLPGNNVAVPKPLVSNESQRSSASSSFKTETTTGPNSGYQQLPVNPNKTASLPGSNQYDKVNTSKGGYESANSSLSGGSSAGGHPLPSGQNSYDKIPSKSAPGYDNAKSPIGGTASGNSSIPAEGSDYQRLPLKSGYESVNSSLSAGSSTGSQPLPPRQNTYDKIPTKTAPGYENAKTPIAGTVSGNSSVSGSGSSYQTLPLKRISFDKPASAPTTTNSNRPADVKSRAGGYESVNTALPGGSSSGYQTLPLKSNTYGKVSPGRATADYDKISSGLRQGTPAGTAVGNQKPKVPMPATKPAAQPLTATYMPAPRGQALPAASTGKTNVSPGSGELKRGVTTTGNIKALPAAGSAPGSAIPLPSVKQSQEEASKKAKEASTKRELQRKLGAKRPGKG